ncbi:hypothetical protein F4677DRAFT_422266 [Hypoxylon crocopeplum]|nr:hypothetical protein F4677DRAFT_422266 [Hypoxylon crocopeplum]
MSSPTPSTTPPEAQSPSFQWEESRDGVWERNIDECEKFYRLSTRKGNGCYPVTGCASFIVNSSASTINENGDEKDRYVENAFRKAWITLNYRHPTLRSHVEHDTDSDRWMRVYSTFQGEDEEKRWLNSTFKIVDTDIEPIQWFNENSPTFEISTLFLVREKQGKEHRQTVFLRCPHDVTDGVGILQLVDQLFNHAALAYDQGVDYALPKWGREHERLSPCLRVAASIPESFSETQTKRFQEIQTQNGAIYNHAGFLSLPSSSKTAVASQEGKRQRIPLSVPKPTTKKILRSCKAIAPGVSVTHVFMSALAQALSELQPQKEESYPVRYVNHSMINLRPYCQDPYKSPEHAAAAYHTVSTQALGIDLVVPGSAADSKNGDKLNDLPQIAVKVRDFYKAVRPVSPTDDQIMLAPLTFKGFMPPPDSDPHAVSEPPFCPVALSSIGNVDSMVGASHGPFQLKNVWAASEPIGAGVAVFLGTWDGMIELSAVFDTRYHDVEYIERFLGRILNCACKGLGVDRHAAPKQVKPVKATENNKRKREDEETPGPRKEISQRREARSPVRPALQERPTLGNVSRQPGKKVANNNTGGRREEKVESE